MKTDSHRRAISLTYRRINDSKFAEDHEFEEICTKFATISFVCSHFGQWENVLSHRNAFVFWVETSNEI
jgi:hypothetical protein